MSTFDRISGQYQQNALVPQAAAENLLALPNIGERDDGLDVACGPGHIEVLAIARVRFEQFGRFGK
jgi:hypothetical protein